MPENLSFSATVQAFAKKVKARELAIFRESSQRVIDEMREPISLGGRLPFKTGFLRASLMASLGDPGFSVTYRHSGTVAVPQNDTAVSLVIAGATITDRINAIFTASYAMRMEYGFVGADSLGREYNQSGYGFVRSAAQRWKTIVREVCAEVKAKIP